MLFTSPLFLFVFLPLFLSIYYLVPNTTPRKKRNCVIGQYLVFFMGRAYFCFYPSFRHLHRLSSFSVDQPDIKRQTCS